MTEIRSREQLEGRMRTLLADLLVLHPEEIRSDSLLVDDLDADSITFLELYFLLKSEFSVDLPEVKVDEETLRLPLLDGLERLESISGGTTLFEYIKQEAVQVVGAELVEKTDQEGLGQVLRAQTVARLASITGGRVPAGLAADASLASLCLKDLFRFLTVESLTGYIEFLMARRPPPAG